MVWGMSGSNLTPCCKKIGRGEKKEKEGRGRKIYKN
jgi:hypothetical protein